MQGGFLPKSITFFPRFFFYQTESSRMWVCTDYLINTLEICSNRSVYTHCYAYESILKMLHLSSSILDTLKIRHFESAAIWKINPLPIFHEETFRQGPMCGILPGREREALQVHLEVSHSTKINLHPLRATSRARFRPSSLSPCSMERGKLLTHPRYRAHTRLHVNDKFAWRCL